MNRSPFHEVKRVLGAVASFDDNGLGALSTLVTVPSTALAGANLLRLELANYLRWSADRATQV